MIYAIVCILLCLGAWLRTRLLSKESEARRLLLEEITIKPGHGFDLAQRIMARCNVELNPGILYPVLRAMQREGVIWMRIEPGSELRGGRPLYVYYLPERPVKKQRAQPRRLRQVELPRPVVAANQVPKVIINAADSAPGIPFAVTGRQGK